MRGIFVVGQNPVPTTANLAVSCLLLGGCASPIHNLRPILPESEKQAVYVSVDAWHATRCFPQMENLSAIGHQFPVP